MITFSPDEFKHFIGPHMRLEPVTIRDHALDGASDELTWRVVDGLAVLSHRIDHGVERLLDVNSLLPLSGSVRSP